MDNMYIFLTNNFTEYAISILFFYKTRVALSSDFLFFRLFIKVFEF